MMNDSSAAASSQLLEFANLPFYIFLSFLQRITFSPTQVKISNIYKIHNVNNHKLNIHMTINIL